MKAIPGCIGYLATPDGNIYSEYSQRFLKGNLSANGYFRVEVRIDGVRKNQPVHRLVARAFIPNPDKLPHINHINGVRTDNRVENLEWCTPKGNTQNAVERGTHVSISNKQGRPEKLDIIQAHRKYGLSFAKIGKLIGVSEQRAWQIFNGR